MMGGAFGGDVDFTWNKTTDTLTLGSSPVITTLTDGDGLNIGTKSTSSGNAGSLSLTTGNGAATNGRGGSFSVEAGAGTGSGNGGSVSLFSGTGGSSGNGGLVEIDAGDGGSTGNGGDISITTGDGLNNTGGDLTILTGEGEPSTGGSNGRLKLGSSVFGTGFVSNRIVGKRSTTNATPTDSEATFMVPMSTNSSVMLRASVVARRTGGTAGAANDSAMYQMVGIASRDAAGPTILYQNNTEAFEDQAGWDCVFAVSSNDIVLQFTGAANNNITWVYELFYITV